MKERILENRRNYSSKNYDEPLDDWDQSLLEPSKKIVANVINGNTFKTTDNIFVQIKGLASPVKDHKGYEHALSDLQSILRKNSAVKIFPTEIDDTGKIIAKVKVKAGDVTNIMKKKSIKTEKGSHDKHRWQEKYEKTKHFHNKKNIK